MHASDSVASRKASHSHSCAVPLFTQTTDDSLAPLSINCWPSVSGAESYVNIEYEATSAFDLQTVVIAIPLPALSHAPRVSQVPSRVSRLLLVCVSRGSFGKWIAVHCCRTCRTSARCSALN